MTTPDSPSPAARTPRTPDLEDSRYGGTRHRSFGGRVLIIVLSVILAGVAAFMVNAFLHTTAADVTAVQSGGRIVDAGHVELSVDVTRDNPDAAAYCIVTAMDYDKNEVGRREFVLPAGGEKITRLTVQIPSRVEAYAGKVYGCSSVLPPHLNATPTGR